MWYHDMLNTDKNNFDMSNKEKKRKRSFHIISNIGYFSLIENSIPHLICVSIQMYHREYM